VVVTLVSWSATPRWASASIHTGFTPERAFDVAPGVQHARGSVLVNQGARRDVSVVSVNAQHPGIDLRLSQADDLASKRETVLDQALAYSQEGRRVVASVNGSLFSYVYDGTANSGFGIGFNVSDGELVNAGRLGRPGPSAAFGINELGEPIIGTPDPVITLTLPSADQVPIDRINQKRQPGRAVLYTPKMGATTMTDALGIEYVIDGFDLPLTPAGTYSGTVTEVRQGLGNTPIGPGQVVLSVSASAPAWPVSLQVGDTVTVDVSVAAGWQSVSQAVGGRDLLVAGGASVVPAPDTDGSHPRTAVGIRADDSVFLVTAADKDLAKGMTLTDLAQLMIDMGAVDALNLDGGGSMQMAVREPGDVEASAITPPEAEDAFRPVSNALQVVSTAPTGQLANLVVDPEQATVAINTPISFEAKAQDSALNGVAPPTDMLQWSVSPANGGKASEPIDQPTPTTATFSLPKAGDYVVTLRADEMAATADVTAAVDLAPPTVTNLVASLPVGGSVSQQGASLLIGWSVQDDIGVTDVEVQKRINKQTWQPLSGEPSAIAAQLEVGYGDTMRFRVRASDASGNVSQWVTSAAYRLRLVNDTNRRVATSGTWERIQDTDALRGQYLSTQEQGATATMAFRGLQVAIVGNRGPTLGVADVSFASSTEPDTVSASSHQTLRREVLYAGPLWPSAHGFVLTLTNGSGGLNSGFELDAYLVLQAG
jgi:hypothetical protein